ncbi:MAG: PAS domain-containing protein [Nanoarchaeota archaeon]|nr:PAS domain-containing protein [Nanoarchaeota archaeon]
MVFYKIGKGIMRLYNTTKASIGSPASIVRRFPASWLEQHAVLKIEREAAEAAQKRNDQLTTQLSEAVSYAGRIEKEAGRKDYALTELEARAEAAEKQYRAAQHWKRDVVLAGQELLQTRAEFEALRTKRAVVFAADHNDRVSYASIRALKLLGYTFEDIQRTNIYNYLKGADKKNSGQIKVLIQSAIIGQDQSDKVSLPDALLIRSGDRKPIKANLTIISIRAGSTYIGTVIRGESKEERQERRKKETAKQTAERLRQQEATEAELAKSQGIVTEALKVLRRLKPKSQEGN